VRAIVDRALAKDPGARWPSASAMAAVARQAAASLTAAAHQPASQPVVRTAGPINQPTGRPQSSPPMMGSPAGNAHPPYPPVQRPVSGARGAASVPPVTSGPPAQPQPYRPPYQPQSMPMAKPESSGGRQVLIVLAVVLGLLVLLCAGVISFLVNQGRAMGPPNGPRDPAFVVQKGVADGEPSASSYRLTLQAGAIPGWFRANEGRQTL
jgi:hypothetical protein